MLVTNIVGLNFVGLFLVSVGKITYKISVGVQSHDRVKPNSVELSWGWVEAELTPFHKSCLKPFCIPLLCRLPIKSCVCIWSQTFPISCMATILGLGHTGENIKRKEIDFSIPWSYQSNGWRFKWFWREKEVFKKKREYLEWNKVLGLKST